MAKKKDVEAADAAEVEAVEETTVEPALEPANEPDEVPHPALTIPGGAYIVQGRWVDAEGNLLPQIKIDQAKALYEKLGKT